MKTRIEELKQKIREATGQSPAFGTAPDCPPEIEETFLERVLAFETSPKRTLFDVLGDFRIVAPPPKDLKDKQLTPRLWEVINALLLRDIVICNTDHLSDRELYEQLWNDTLREEFVICPPELEYILRIDMTRTRAEDQGIPIYLKYYASDEQRKSYAQTYPDRPLPKHVEPPRRRDHLIPDEPTHCAKKPVN